MNLEDIPEGCTPIYSTDSMNSWNDCDCTRLALYNDYFEVTYCSHCDKWLENKCGDIMGLCHCFERPDKPSQMVKKIVGWKKD